MHPLVLVLIVLLVLLMLAGLPIWPYSTHFGYYPSGGLATLLLVVILLVLITRL